MTSVWKSYTFQKLLAVQQTVLLKLIDDFRIEILFMEKIEIFDLKKNIQICNFNCNSVISSETMAKANFVKRMDSCSQKLH